MITVLLAISISSSAPDVPDAPMAAAHIQQAERRNLSALDYALYGCVVAYRTEDYLSTSYNLGHGGHEWFLPTALAKSHAGFAVFSGGMAAGEIAGSYWLHRHGHAKLARTMDFLSVASGTSIAISNEVH